MRQRWDVLVVGGGPAGSSTALGLAGAGLDVAVWDRSRFPRDKTCAGWITPQILDELDVDSAEYARGRVLQPIRGFRLGRIGGRQLEIRYPDIVSYGILRREFDHYLLDRCGARLLLGRPLRSLERARGGIVVNGTVHARLIVGAGGHFCPVARWLGARIGAAEPAVVAREVEFAMTPEQVERCPVQAEVPELYFLPDLSGYGWIFRKGNHLNVGLGRQDPRGFPRRLDDFLAWLAEGGRLPGDLPSRMHGHAYLLYDSTPRRLVAEAALLVGDAAGVAYARSGEGIRPAVESGLLAARTIAASEGRYDEARLGAYARAIEARFGPRRAARGERLDWLPAAWRRRLVGWLFGERRFVRRVLLDRWFLHRDLAPLPAPRRAGSPAAPAAAARA